MLMMAAIFRMFTIISALLGRTNMAPTGKGHRARSSRGRTRPLTHTWAQTYTRCCGRDGEIENKKKGGRARHRVTGRGSEREREGLQTQHSSELIGSDRLLISQLAAYTHAQIRAEKWTLAQERPILTCTFTCNVLWRHFNALINR